MNNIILIGMPSCGKSTVGVLLAKNLGYRFIDTDLAIQEHHGKLLHEIIAERGIEGFLQLENEVCAALEASRTVISTGGSAVYGKEAMAHLKSIGTVIYLKISYETLAAETTVEQLDLPSGAAVTTASQYVTVLWVMTLGIIVGLLLVPIFTKKIQGGLKNMEKKDKRWGEIFNNAMFLGMISAFLGYVFCDVSTVFSGDLSGLIPVLVMAASALIMVICGLASRVKALRWLTDYALPFSLIGGMASAIPITAWLG